MALALLSPNLKSQEINLQTAIDAIEHESYTKALQFLKKAQEHPETKDQARTWYWRGKLMAKIAKARPKKLDDRVKDPVKEGLQAVEKCRKLDKNGRFEEKVASLKKWLEKLSSNKTGMVPIFDRYEEIEQKAYLA
ncbi:MAG: hypothetical protein ABEH38_08160 [Flavobacteriales bacterium]